MLGLEEYIIRLCPSAKDGCVRTCPNALAFAPCYIADIFQGISMSYIDKLPKQLLGKYGIASYILHTSMIILGLQSIPSITFKLRGSAR